MNKKGDTVYVIGAESKTKYVYNIDKDEMKESGEEILDYYFGIKDGVDTFIYGGRTIDNPDIWNDDDWLNTVKKINEYK